MSLLLRFILLAWFLIPFISSGKEIAITFDDVPMPGSAIYSREEKINILLAKLRASSVQAAFFCIGSYVEEEGNCIEKIANQNHFLANHSFQHPSLSRISINQFIQEIDQTESYLSKFPTWRKWFRFPFLDYGNQEIKGGSFQKKEDAFAVLAAKGYLHGYVTVNTFDWHLNYRLQQACREQKKIHFSKLKDVYLTLIYEWLTDYDAAWEKIMDRPMIHVLLLHENDLNALFITDLVDFLREKGWTIVSPQKAYADASLHYTTMGDLYFKRYGSSPEAVKSLSTAHIDQLLANEHVFEEIPSHSLNCCCLQTR